MPLLYVLLAAGGAVGFFLWNRERLADDEWIELNRQNPVTATALVPIVNGTVTDPALVGTAIVQLRTAGFPHLADKIERQATGSIV